jgi:hypothetical protein
MVHGPSPPRERFTASEHHQPAKLSIDVQRAIGRALRDSYCDVLRATPAQFFELWHRLPAQKTSNERVPAIECTSVHDAARGTESDKTSGCKDPEVLSLLSDALDEGWATLCSIGNRTGITREQLARQILTMWEAGERHRPRLAARSLLTLLSSRL